MRLVFKDGTIVAFGIFFPIAGTIVLFFSLAFHSAELSANSIIKASSGISTDTSLALRVTTHMGDNHTFYENDTVSFLVRTSKDAFLLLVYENSEHNYFQIYPSNSSEHVTLRAGGYRPIPGIAGTSGFRVTAPFGKEKLWAFASSAQIPDFLRGVSKSGFISLADKKIDTIRERFFSHCNQVKAQCSETSTTFFTAKSDSQPKHHASIFTAHSAKDNIRTQLTTTNNTYSHIEKIGGCLEKDSNNEKAACCGENSTYGCSAYDPCKHTKCI